MARLIDIYALTIASQKSNSRFSPRLQTTLCSYSPSTGAWLMDSNGRKPSPVGPGGHFCVTCSPKLWFWWRKRPDRSWCLPGWVMPLNAHIYVYCSVRTEHTLFNIHMSLTFYMCLRVHGFTPTGVRASVALHILELISPRMQCFPVPLALRWLGMRRRRWVDVLKYEQKWGL